MPDPEKIDINSYVAGVSLREYFDSRLAAIEKATSLAKADMEKRLDSMNEFRHQLDRQTRDFVNIINYDKDIDRLDKDIRDLRDSKNQLEGKASMKSVIIGYIFTAIAIIIGIIKLFD
jgi:septal ring factor EnvC (AmiA/AmiB activator)